MRFKTTYMQYFIIFFAHLDCRYTIVKCMWAPDDATFGGGHKFGGTQLCQYSVELCLCIAYYFIWPALKPEGPETQWDELELTAQSGLLV